jgi:hypothetical protein
MSGKHSKSKRYVSLWLDARERDRLDEFQRIWGFPNRGAVVRRLLQYAVGEVDRLSPMPKRTENNS